MTVEHSPFAVVVVNYGSHDLVAVNLTRTLAGMDDVVGVVVDNFTDDAERAAVEAMCREAGWVAVLLDANLGFGAGVRVGIARARESGAQTFLLLNPDAWIEPAALRRLLVDAQANPRQLIAPLVVRPDGTTFAELQDLSLADGTMRATRARASGVPDAEVITWVSGACVALSAELWDATGGFDEDYFLYWEDVDLSARVWSVGGTVRVDETITALHDEGGTHGFTGPARAKSPIYYYYNVRNRLVFASKHLDEAGQARWRRSAVRIAYRVLLQGGRRQFVHPSKNLLPGLRGVQDGGRYLTRNTPRKG